MKISQKFSQFDDPIQMEPLMPSEFKLAILLEKAHDIIRAAEQLKGHSQPSALNALKGLLRTMNSYYSNLIEGQNTLPHEITLALKKQYDDDQDKARRQRLAVSHITTEIQLEESLLQLQPKTIWSATWLEKIHYNLFNPLDATDKTLADGQFLIPGQLRTKEVSVGRHVAPLAKSLNLFLQRWSQTYGNTRRGEMQLIAIFASHHRLAWIHPFEDGNGRVARLHTHLAITDMGLSNGLWSQLRGFARTQKQYYSLLDAADQARAGDLDGRGNLSEKALIEWIDYCLNLASDQISLMQKMLNLADMRNRIEAHLHYEQHVVKQGVRTEAWRVLHYLFATQSELPRADFKSMLGLSDRAATDQIKALLNRGLIESDSPYGKLRWSIPQHALRFLLPNLWPEAEIDSANL